MRCEARLYAIASWKQETDGVVNGEHAAVGQDAGYDQQRRDRGVRRVSAADHACPAMSVGLGLHRTRPRRGVAHGTGAAGGRHVTRLRFTTDAIGSGALE